jgi:phosphoribosylformylglycinamidine synthase II
MDTIRKQDTISVENPEDKGLQEFLVEQNISLKPNELLQIRSMLERDPTRVELHIFNVMWSEHCSYKSSKALLKEHLPTEAPHVVLGPGEDAGIVRFFEKEGKQYCLVMAHESHNHPSQVLPVEGAATGIGGIVRDVYCMGADVIGVMDPLRFGDPDGPNGKRVREIVRGVVDGIAQYGNALGVPNYGGDTCFDERFDDNCLVNVVALGVVVEEDIIRSRAPGEAQREPHDIILIGKPTDASGFGGAAFASVRLSGDQTEERQEAVQVPDPFLKRVLAEATKAVLAAAKRDGVPIGFKDLGAGGISCAVSEMAQAGGVGATLDLDRVNTASLSFLPEVIACSETQERYAMIVPRSFTETVCRVYNEDFELPHLYPGAGAYVIGNTTMDKRFKLISKQSVICDADVDVITTGIEYERPARKRELVATAGKVSEPTLSIAESLIELLSAYNISDKSILYRHYDSEVQGHAVLRPGEADAAVAVVLPGETVGVAASVGGNPRIGLVDPYLAGAWAVVEAVRNVACVGGTPLAITDCLNFGDPEDPEVFWEFSEGVRGVGDACRGLRVTADPSQSIPVISGNVSFYNQSGNGRPIAPSPIVACAGRVQDASVARSLGFKQPGSHVVLLGHLHDRIGGSEYAKRFLDGGDFEPPRPDFQQESAMIRALIEGIENRFILAAHDISHGGLAVAIAEMVIGSAPLDIGCDIRLGGHTSDDTRAVHHMFSEYGGVIIEVASDIWSRFREDLKGDRVDWMELGRTHERPVLELRLGEEQVEVPIEALRSAHRGGKINPLFA